MSTHKPMGPINRLRPEWFTRKRTTPTSKCPTRVLLADDEASVRFSFRAALESVGHEVIEAEDGFRALEQLRRDRVDVVLLDLRMPRLDGLEALSQLRSEGANVPVVIVTGVGTSKDVARAVLLGIADVLSKPVTPLALRRAVAAAVAVRAEGVMRSASDLDSKNGTFEELLAMARRAMRQRQFATAEPLLVRALNQNPNSSEAHTLKGIFHETLGEHHTAYHAYKAALALDPRHGPAQRLMRSYCERFGFDPDNPSINPGART
jgi:CheY-like chemotaxis protein